MNWGRRGLQFAIFLGLLVTSVSAQADQCIALTRAQAEAAVRVLMDTRVYQELCEPCGESKPSSPKRIKTLTLEDDGTNTWAISLNGKEVDLAYTFVNSLNLSKIVGCPSTSVSASIAR